MEGTDTQADQFLIDTNIFLEFLLEQKRVKESLELMRALERGDLTGYVTSFALHSIEVNLARVGKTRELLTFLTGIVETKGLTIYTTSVNEEKDAVAFIKKFSFDFDDALQYYVSKKLDLVLVSFDHDFDRTDIQRLEPHKVIKRHFVG